MTEERGTIRAALVADLLAGMRNHSSGKSPDLAEHLADVLLRDGAYAERVQDLLDDYRTRLLDANTERDAARSDAAALRDAGNNLVAGVEHYLSIEDYDGAEAEAILRTIDAWRSVAGKPATETGAQA